MIFQLDSSCQAIPLCRFNNTASICSPLILTCGRINRRKWIAFAFVTWNFIPSWSDRLLRCVFALPLLPTHPYPSAPRTYSRHRLSVSEMITTALRYLTPFLEDFRETIRV